MAGDSQIQERKRAESMTTMNRERGITRTSLIGVAANTFLSMFKALVGLASGSISILLDAVNNLTDMISSLVTIVGIRMSKKKPDEKHPFGHGRIEYFSAIIVAGVVIAAGIAALYESILKIIHPVIPAFSAGHIAVISAAVVIKLILGRYTRLQGEKYKSEALKASGADALFDALLSMSTLLGICITLFFRITVDGWIGAVIAIFILKAGWDMLKEPISSVIGNRPDSAVSRAIRKTVCEHSPIIGAYDLVLHDYGPEYAIGSIRIEIPATMTADEIHRLTRHISDEVMEKYHVILTIGIYAIDESHQELRKSIHKTAMEHAGVLGTHAIYIDDTEKYITIDVITDFEVNCEVLKEDLEGHIHEYLPDYRVEINFEHNYTD